MEANSRLLIAANAMLDELEMQATTTRLAHHFIYEVQENSGIGKYLSPKMQIEMLMMLHTKGIIAGFGKNIHDHSEQSSYFVELEDKSFRRERKLINSPGFFKDTASNRITPNSSRGSDMYRVSINLDGGTLFLKINDEQSWPIARFSEGSKMKVIMTKLFADKVGVSYRNTDFSFGGASVKTNLGQIFTNGRYGHLLQFMDTNLLPRSISLKSREINLSRNELKHFLTQINARFRRNFAGILDRL